MTKDVKSTGNKANSNSTRASDKVVREAAKDLRDQAASLAARSKSAVRSRGAKHPNRYLASVLDPDTSVTRIPDDETAPSGVMKIKVEVPVVCDAEGDFVLCIAPTLYNGLLSPAKDHSTGELSLNAGLTAGPPPNTTFASVGSIAYDQSILSVLGVASAIRAIGMKAKFVPTEAALTIQGIQGGVWLSREQLPFPIDLPTIAGASTLVGLGNGANTVSALVASTSSDTCPLNQPSSLFWRPEDDSDLKYRSVLIGDNNTVSIQQASGPAATDTCQWKVSTFSSSTISALDGYSYAAPFDFGPSGIDSVPGYVSTPYADDGEWAYPYLIFFVQGGVAGPDTQAGVLTITTSFQFLLNALGANVVATEPTVSNPLELAHADNVLQYVPPFSYAGSPGTSMLTAAVSAAQAGISDLSDVTGSEPLKKALNGLKGGVAGLAADAIFGSDKASSLISTVGNFVSGML